MRDYAKILQLVILSNLENLNSEMITQGIEQKIRLERLYTIAKKYSILQDSNSIKKLKCWMIIKYKIIKLIIQNSR